ncbi:MAG: damage-control phosphatase ARMT1 family protein [Halanaerobiales bacterium]
MKIEMDCIPCLLRQTLEASRMATGDEGLIRDILNEYAREIPQMNGELGPHISGRFQEIIKQKTGVDDPYLEVKKNNIEMARFFFEEVQEVVDRSQEPLLGSLIMAAMGNSLDAGLNLDVDLKEGLRRALEDGFVRSDYDQFFEKIKESETILIVADNSGEAVFDSLLIEELKKFNLKMIYAVREVPVLNDVTLDVARDVGIDDLCTVISSGVKTPGIVLEESSAEFKKYFRTADVVISKGMGNLEALTETDREIYYLLKAKCNVIAGYLDVKIGDLVFVRE